MKIFNKLSIIIITYNEEENISNIIIDLKKQEFENFEIIISDSNSLDKTEKKANQFENQFKEFRFENFKKTLGPSYGRNYGANLAKYELLLFLDADSRIKDKLFLKNFIKYINKYKIDGGGFYLKSKNNSIYSIFGHKLMNLGFFLTQYLSPTACGACMFSTKKMFKTINGFRENVSLCEDCDYVRDGKRAKFKIRMIPISFEFSDRRLNVEGYNKVVLKYFKANIIRFITGKSIKKNKIKYDFGIYNK